MALPDLKPTMSMLAKCPPCNPRNCKPDLEVVNVRAYYMGVTALVYGGLAAGLVGILDAPVSDGSEDHRRQECALQGATAQLACPPATADDKAQNDNIFGISIAAMVVNLFVILYLLGTMSSPKWSAWAFKGQWVLELLNVGLFAGLVAWFDQSENLLDEANVENSVFFGEGNVYIIAWFGLAMAVADVVLFNLLKFFYFGTRCDVSFELNVPQK
tara:strand:- start:2590 stop:3234 length:645 start_codon:yes stop_codon:yes gene_type:complete